MESIAKLYGFEDEIEWKEPAGGVEDSPFWYLKVPNEEAAQKLAARAMLIKGLYDLWGEGKDHEELKAKLRAYPEDKQAPYIREDTTFKIVVEGFGCALDLEEQLDVIRDLSFMKFKGKVRLSNPEHEFWYIQTADGKRNNGMDDDIPQRVYFGREVGRGNRNNSANKTTAPRQLITRLALKDRKYLGPTSMDTEMSLIMANQGLVCEKSWVYDPFVGTGSVLVGAAAFGAKTMGSDIDIRCVRPDKFSKSGEKVSLQSNFLQYGFAPPIGVLRMDSHRPAIREDLECVFDAIICDPPYGMRAGGRKSGGRKFEAGPYVIREEQRPSHIPSTQPYPMYECMDDLLDFSARILKLGGRLVYFFPAAVDLYEDQQVPQHPALHLVSNSEQVLSTYRARRLITMEKVRDYDREEALESRRQQEGIRSEWKEVACGTSTTLVSPSHACFDCLEVSIGPAGDPRMEMAVPSGKPGRNKYW